jgi:crotonobetaine/carnitine-CoA ligase
MILDIEPTGRALWRERVRLTPERTFLRWSDRTWTYAEFDEEMLRLAGGLQAAGVTRGTRVVVALPNRPEAIRVLLALHHLGSVYVPLMPNTTVSELAFPIGHCEAELVIADEQAAPVILGERDRFPHLRRLISTASSPASIDPGARVERLSEMEGGAPLAPEALAGYDDNALAAILYTSGSTGRPKGVLIGAGSFYSVGQAYADRFEVTAEDIYLLPTPFGHAVGALTSLSATLHTGGSLAMVDRFSPSRFWRDVEQHKATYSVLFPAHLNLLLETAEPAAAAGATSLRLVITHSFVKPFRERFGVELATVWGMTETGALSVGSEPGYSGELGDNYVGTPMLGVELATYDERMRPCPAGRPGEIALRHPHVMQGYLNDEAATRQTLVDGWVRSGDQGTIDEQGRLFFVGRLKNMIKRSGENISAEEVETALLEHPDVSECSVFAVPDRIRTEEVAAVAVRKAGSVLDEQTLRGSCEQRLIRWKLPRYIIIRDEPLPRLGNGKLDRVAMAASIDLGAAWDATGS